MFKEAAERFVEGAGAELGSAIADILYIFEDGVAMFFAIPQGEEDVERCFAERSGFWWKG